LAEAEEVAETGAAVPGLAEADDRAGAEGVAAIDVPAGAEAGATAGVGAGASDPITAGEGGGGGGGASPTGGCAKANEAKIDAVQITRFIEILAFKIFYNLIAFGGFLKRGVFCIMQE
jgi:hypothetical protein